MAMWLGYNPFCHSKSGLRVRGLGPLEQDLAHSVQDRPGGGVVRLRVVLATSMVEEGVDIPRLDASGAALLAAAEGVLHLRLPASDASVGRFHARPAHFRGSVWVPGAGLQCAEGGAGAGASEELLLENHL
jgi:hypothetical protein